MELWIAPVIGVIALLVAVFYTARVNKVAEGTDRMKEIASYIHEGAMAFLTREYKMMAVFIVILFIILCVTRPRMADSCLLLNRCTFLSSGWFLRHERCYQSKRKNCECR